MTVDLRVPVVMVLVLLRPGCFSETADRAVDSIFLGVEISLGQAFVLVFFCYEEAL